MHEVAPASAVSCPPPTKTLRRKLGDFFTLKKRRGLKSETSQEGRPKKASIADFIRPLREVARAEKDKDKDKVKVNEKENEKEKGKDSTDSGEDVQGISVSGAPPMRGEAVPPRRALREGKSQSLILLSGSASGATRNKVSHMYVNIEINQTNYLLLFLDFRNNLMAKIALNRNFISCSSVLEFPNPSQKRHRCVHVLD